MLRDLNVAKWCKISWSLVTLNFSPATMGYSNDNSEVSISSLMKLAVLLVPMYAVLGCPTFLQAVPMPSWHKLEENVLTTL